MSSEFGWNHPDVQRKYYSNLEPGLAHNSKGVALNVVIFPNADVCNNKSIINRFGLVSG